MHFFNELPQTKPHFLFWFRILVLKRFHILLFGLNLNSVYFFGVNWRTFFWDPTLFLWSILTGLTFIKGEKGAVRLLPKIRVKMPIKKRWLRSVIVIWDQRMTPVQLLVPRSPQIPIKCHKSQVYIINNQSKRLKDTQTVSAFTEND